MGSRPVILMAVIPAISMCCGCVDRLMQATMAPQAAVAETLTNASTAAAQPGSMNNAAIQDIDRILERNPDVANRSDLIAMRNQLAGTRGAISASGMNTMSLSRRDSPIYRSLPHRPPDRPLRMPQPLRGYGGLTQPETPAVTVYLVPQTPTRTWVTTDVSPVRLR